MYVEGGGDHNKALQTECRKGFSKFFERSGLKDRMPKVVACGSRAQAFDRFRAATEETAILLVDSEGPPDGGPAKDEHWMVQAMEGWFHADKDARAEFYGKGFRRNALKSAENVEIILKGDLFAGLKHATKDCSKGAYSKGGHSFKMLERIDPAKVRAASGYADRLLNHLDSVCK